MNQKWKIGIILFLTIVTLHLGAQTFKNELILTSDFEDGKVGKWGPRGTEKVEVTTEVAKGGKYSLKISERTKTWNGPIHVLTEKPVPEDTYIITAWIYYKEGPAQSGFVLSAERSFQNEKQDHSYTNVASFLVKRGEWTQVSAEYNVPKDPTQKTIWFYFELPYKDDASVTANDKITFYIDDVKVEKLDPAAKPKIELGIPSLYETLSKWFSVGAAVEPEDVEPSTQKAQLMIKHFDTMVAGNAHKMDSVQPKEGQFDWSRADKIIEFGEMTGMRLRWHTLVWHNQVPAWFFQDPKDPNKPASKELLNQRLKTHIQTVVRRYKGRVESYDVVNEVISDNGGLRTGAEGSKWYQILGPEYIENAFRWAREIDPNAQLVINDYNLESNARKRQDMYNLVRDLKRKGVPIDAVGLQMHISINYPSIQEIRETINLFASLGVKVIITELDVSIYDNPSEPKKNITNDILLRQAQRYKELFDLFKEAANKKQLDTVVIWGLTDDGSWLNNFPVPGRTNAPLLFDKQLKAKPAFWAIVDPKKVPGLR
ncbi:endo-1,4-beta-xylanase [Treponema sp. J25]|uniref:endo-1,4-beta-xylanase n=1 Tax=Treponema sp. J25 TaxID=2094121 RepID=UPI00104D316B|nr:endo-1,4-beta-xylanase [Treponema sp. J25]TCW61186.1 1,4-beta-xylanase [Treponema sp. J25]